jgi:hypothetical protein
MIAKENKIRSTSPQVEETTRVEIGENKKHFAGTF